MERQSLVILLIEDNLGHAELVKRGLREHELLNQIQHVPNGAAALDYLFQRGQYAKPQQAPRPHLILLDLRLPRVDGLEVLRKIKTDDELHRIPVIVLTTSEAETDIARAYEYHANSYLVKPVNFDEFIQMIDDLGHYWLGWNRRLSQ
jgi:two-component system response regulator